VSELYSHLLIPNDAKFVPELPSVSGFFDHLSSIGAIPTAPEFVVLTNSGKTRPIAGNSGTSESLHGPDLKIRRCSNLQQAIHSMTGKEINELWVQGTAPTAIPPFALYEANRPDVLWNGAYSLTVRCRLRKKTTHLLHSGFGCECDVKANEPSVFENPWTKRPIQTSGLAFVRFWIEFGVGDWLIPMITDDLEILDTRLVESAREVFGVEFTQGCICNDD
jgi:hypothetical protein